MSSRGGRDRIRRDFPPRMEEKSHHGRSNAPPSRHLWVGNLSHSIEEKNVTRHFLKFGELESVSFQPGRSYAFINFKNEEDAFAAVSALNGFVVAGNPLKIEFAKAVSFAHFWLFFLLCNVAVISCMCIFSIGYLIHYLKAITDQINT
ncbi:hypothetical protein CsSME_00026765 [Camellia sinensis var. sinensis]